MNKVTSFSYNLKQLLLREIKSGRISDLSEDEVLNVSPIYAIIAGEKRYFIESNIVDKLNDDIKNKIEVLWLQRE